MADGMRQMFDPFEKVARAHHICPCCERPFSSEEEDDFVIKVDLLSLVIPKVLHLDCPLVVKWFIILMYVTAKSEVCKFCRTHESVGSGVF